MESWKESWKGGRGHGLGVFLNSFSLFFPLSLSRSRSRFRFRAQGIPAAYTFLLAGCGVWGILWNLYCIVECIISARALQVWYSTVLALYHNNIIILFWEEGFRSLLLRIGFLGKVLYTPALPFPHRGHHPREVRCCKV